jgi:hypothetical protein
MSNIKLLHTKPQKTHKEYLEDCNLRKHYNQEIAKKLHNALQIEEQNLAILSDITKIDIKNYAEYQDLHKFQKQASNMQKCCNRFFAEIWESEKLKDTKRKTKPFQTCKNKLCAICCKIRSNRLFNQTYNVVDYIKDQEIKFIPYHLTLTIKNPTYSQFSDYYKIMNDAVHDLLDKHQKSKIYKLRNFVLGWQCAREVSQIESAKDSGELHPHLHILLLLSPDFIVGRSPKLNEDDILAEWNYALKSQKPNFPNCTQMTFKKIQADKKITLLNSEANAIAEVSKYPTKPGDMLCMPDVVLLDLLKNLSGARMVTFGGIIKQVRAELGYSGNVEVVDGFIREDLYKLTGLKLYNFSNGIYKRQNIRKTDLLEYRTISSAELTELNYAKDQEEIKNRSAGVQQYLDQDFSELNKIADIAKYKDYENMADSDLADIANQVLALSKQDFETGKEIKLMQKYINAILISQFIYYQICK